MILVDLNKGSIELLPHIQRLKVQAERSALIFGDFCFEGYGPEGIITIGIERKTLPDMLACIDDSRYGGHQRVGMAQMYQQNYLIIEGVWGVGAPPYQDGILLEQKGSAWIPLRYRTQRVAYSKLRRYLFSVGLTGVQVLYTRDPFHTAQDVVNCYHYWQKQWGDHTAMRAVQKLNIATLQRKPSLTRKWADSIEGVGVKFGEDAERLFRTPVRLANSEETDWLKIKRVGVALAQSIVRQIRGVRL